MLPELATTRISDLKRREPVRLAPSAPLVEAVTLLRERSRGAVVVEDSDGALLGIFTERDLLNRLEHDDHSWHSTTVGEAMTEKPVTIAADASIAAAITRMQAGGFRNLPLVEGGNRVVGIISIRDILRHIVEHHPQEFLNLPPDPDREATSPWGG